MQLIRGQLHLTQTLKQSVVTLGNFDGLHQGHQRLLTTLATEAHGLKVPKVVLSFEPPPQRYFSGDAEFPRLMYWREKWQALAEYQIDYLVCLRFASQLAKMSASEFVEHILVKQLGVQAVVIGDDFRFGAKRAGDIHLLRQLGHQFGFNIIAQPEVSVDQQRVSSTRIRQALMQGDIEGANHLLARPYFLAGKVLRCDQRGRELGFPTANLNLQRKPVPLSGIFAVTVEGLGSEPLPGVASLGVRPMFDGKSRWLEVHLFDFDQDIYGQHIRVNFFDKIRDEVVFDSVEALIDRMHQDVALARMFLSERSL